jgi:hypothetical protein
MCACGRQTRAQESRRTSFDQLHQLVDPVLRVHIHKQVDVIGQNFELLAHVGNDLFLACFDGPHKDFPPVFGTPNRM